MENASQALLIAGGVLIALLVIGLLVWMFTNLSGFQQQEGVQVTSSQIAKFNNEYGSYDKPDLRGSDLYTLLNKVADYNRRQSSAAINETNSTDTGIDIMHEPMTVTFSLNTGRGKVEDFTPDGGTPRLFNRNGYYEQSGTSTAFSDNVTTEVNDLENEYSKDSLTKLVDNITSIFIDESNRTEYMKEAIEKFNSICPSKRISYSNTESDIKTKFKSNLGDNSQIREDVYKYSEYVKFKRAHFECTQTKYDTNTGRIVKMAYEFTGNFE